jgi:hypothetical protein
MDMSAVGSVVNATVEHWYTKGSPQVELVCVEEGDCDWRTADDSSGLDHNWNVIEWEYK